MAGKFEYGLRNGENDAYAEGRARAFGIGPPNPHATTSRKYAAFQAGLSFSGTRDSTPYGPAGWFTQWTAVTFDGTDILTNSTDLGWPATFDTLTACVAFRFTSLPGGVVSLIGHTSGSPLGLLGVGASGQLAVNSPTNFSTAGFVGGGAATAVIQAGVYYVLHVALQGSTQTFRLWLNGVEHATTATWFGTGAFPKPTAWAIGGVPGTASLAADVGLAWVAQGQYITDPSKFYPAYNLGAQLANPGARPGIGFGGVQTAANWNAGTNLGDGTGTWTMTGSVTAG
jgi:hypothetical protein